MGGDPGGGTGGRAPPRICLGSNFFRICHQPFVSSTPCHALTLQEMAAHAMNVFNPVMDAISVLTAALASGLITIGTGRAITVNKTTLASRCIATAHP